MSTIFIESSTENSYELQFIKAVAKACHLEIDDFVYVGGYTNVKKYKNKFLELEDGEKNLVIFDADYTTTGGGFLKRKQWLEQQKNKEIQFELFLFPNNKDDGILETLLQRIVNPKYEQLLSYFKEYEQKISKFNEKLGCEVFETPDEKARIYSYISAFKRTRTERERFKNKHNWNFDNPEYWNMNSEALNPLKDFLKKNV